jgi:lysophospholipase L1-like esterase
VEESPQMNVLTVFLAGVIVLLIGYGLLTLYFVVRLPRNNPKQYIQQKTSRPISHKQTFVMIGDSLTHGTLSVNYVDLLSERFKHEQLHVDVINAGVNGDHAFHVLQRVTDIICCHPDFITILIGTNDAASSVSLNANPVLFSRKTLPQPSTLAFFTSNLQSLVSQLKSETHAKIAVLSLPPIGEDLNQPVGQASSAFSKAIHAVAEHLNVEYLPIHEAMIDHLNNYPAQPKYRYDKHTTVFMISLFRRLLGYPSHQISEKIGFQLHTDFLHLNRTGAELIADKIEGFYRHHQ